MQFRTILITNNTLARTAHPAQFAGQVAGEWAEFSE